MYYFLAKLWCVVSMVLIVVEEANGGGLVVAELREPVFERTKADRAMREYVSFGDAVVGALATEAISFLLGGWLLCCYYFELFLSFLL